MLRFKCPCCGEKAVTLKDKLTIGGNTNTFCRECGGKINTSFWYSTFTYVAYFTVLCFAEPLVKSKLEKFCLAIALALPIFAVSIFLSPLKKGKTKA